jgi:aspartyl-tRNA(Asn)/glutamyl-tRNA(Gln) amidotransferase subunit B
MPGVLPVLNEEVVDLAIRFGLGLMLISTKHLCLHVKTTSTLTLQKATKLARWTIRLWAWVISTFSLKMVRKRIGVTRAHLEEDAGKSIHDQFEGMSGIDLNRAGTPLLEIVSEPDMRSVEEAVAYIKAIHTLVRWLGISDGNMAEGSFRADCNVSLRRPVNHLVHVVS